MKNPQLDFSSVRFLCFGVIAVLSIAMMIMRMVVVMTLTMTSHLYNGVSEAAGSSLEHHQVGRLRLLGLAGRLLHDQNLQHCDISFLINIIDNFDIDIKAFASFLPSHCLATDPPR